MSKPSDRNFDDLVGHFQKNIYDTPKGRIRLEILKRDLIESIPGLTGPEPLDILDAGAGLGYMSGLLSGFGHRLTLCDVSQQILQQAEQQLSQLHPKASFSFINAAFQQLNQHVEQTFDIVLFHAVMEWLEQPREALSQIMQHAKPGGYLSLMYYNRHSLVYRHLLNANFRVLKDNRPRLGDRLVPVSPLEPEQIRQWFEEENLELVCSSGVRVIFDYLNQQEKQRLDFDELIEMEKRYSRLSPYADLARYQHCILRRP